MPLGPSAATGLCGRPLCCLAYEQPTYQAAKGRVPRVGESVLTERGLGRVIARNVLKENVTVQLEDGTNATLAVETVKVMKANARAGDEAAEE